MNESDSERYAGQLESLGYRRTEDMDMADVILLNTCCVRETAEGKILGKIGELKHQDIGQMQMYVHYYDRKVRLPEENPTIGIILCRDKNNAVVEMTLPEDNSQIFASKYETVLPSKEALQKLLQEQITDEDGGEDE